MQNRRDHVQAHRFAVGRLVSALLAGDPGPVEVPMRRGNLGMQFGALVAVLLAAGFGVYGLISPKESTAWRNPGSIIVEEETGNRYLLLDQQLYPMANYASALLVAGARAKTVSVARDTLAEVRRGPQLGIVGAPDEVPPATDLLSGDRAVCLPPGSAKTLVDLDPAGRSTPVPRNQRVLLSGPDRTTYLVWNSRAYKLSHAELVALGMVTQRTVRVSSTWLAQLPSGGKLTAPRIPEAGSAGSSVAGESAKVGQLFETTAAGAREMYVLLTDGLAPINRTEFALLSAVPGASTPRQVTTADIAAAPVSQDRSLLTAVPDLLSGPAFSPGGSALCVLQKAGSSKGGTVVTEPIAAGPRPSGLFVPPAKGLIVAAESAQAPDATSRIYLITDSGRKYPFANTDALAALGYGQAKVRTLPRQLLDLAPTGPTLDTTTAKTAVSARAG
ncbi:type VII secretion protein EccB [Streptomyces sp. DT2A-34]|uniref:type VII secretion protein EccB n=1 Tax=Streptomyces sp. DT2A-34 TaxID=3051182 RepID=UPI00265BFA65|nr:type VII secretion protein EccB [Streptomyces sp. DT2A-34]MDO0916584.1 type VII secretion protein EccB [Streptomyces sp. DT2A-34]